MYLKDNEFWVKSGDIKSGVWTIKGQHLTDGETAINIQRITYCSLIKDVHETSQSGAGRIAGGILGAALLGPIGAIGGLLAGGKKRVDETVVMCSLNDNRTFTAESTQTGAATLQRIAAENSKNLNDSSVASKLPSGPLSNEDIECPECAEFIKRKAKICRYCGHILSKDLDQTRASTSNELSTETLSIGQLSRFISDYRSQVNDASFKDDAEIANVISRYEELQREGSKRLGQHCHEVIAKELGYRKQEIEKLLGHIWPMSILAQRFQQQAPFKQISTEMFNEVLEVLSIISLDYFELPREEKLNLAAKLILERTEKIIDPQDVSFLEHLQPSVFRKGPIYAVNGCIISVEPEARKMKLKK